MEVPSTLIDLGIHVLGREVTDMVPKDREVYIEWEIFQQLQEIRLLKTLASRAYQRDIGSPWQLPWRLNGAPCDAVGRGDESKHLSIDLSSSRSKDESLLSPASIAQGREIEAGGATCGPISLGEKCLVGERGGGGRRQHPFFDGPRQGRGRWFETLWWGHHPPRLRVGACPCLGKDAL